MQTTYKQQIEAIQAAKKIFDGPEFTELNQFCTALNDAGLTIAALNLGLKSESDWVLCKERLPDKNLNRVLAWHKRNKQVVIAFCNGNDKYGNTKRQVFRTDLYSHWKPLSEDPKQ